MRLCQGILISYTADRPYRALLSHSCLLTTWKESLTLGTCASEGYSSWVCVFVCSGTITGWCKQMYKLIWPTVNI